MIKRFLPDMYQESIFTINYKKLKKNGIKCILFDVDNTITPAREEKFYEQTKKLINKLNLTTEKKIFIIIKIMPKILIVSFFKTINKPPIIYSTNLYTFSKYQNQHIYYKFLYN